MNLPLLLLTTVSLAESSWVDAPASLFVSTTESPPTPECPCAPSSSSIPTPDPTYVPTPDWDEDFWSSMEGANKFRRADVVKSDRTVDYSTTGICRDGMPANLTVLNGTDIPDQDIPPLSDSLTVIRNLDQWRWSLYLHVATLSSSAVLHEFVEMHAAIHADEEHPLIYLTYHQGKNFALEEEFVLWIGGNRTTSGEGFRWRLTKTQKLEDGRTVYGFRLPSLPAHIDTSKRVFIGCEVWGKLPGGRCPTPQLMADMGFYVSHVVEEPLSVDLDD